MNDINLKIMIILGPLLVLKMSHKIYRAATWIGTFNTLGWLIIASAALAQPSTNPPSLQSCGALPTEALRLECANRLAGKAASATPLSGGWRLSRTSDPHSGTPQTAVTRTADLQASDAGFAGLMFRCTASRLEALLVMLDPVPPGSKPKVTIRVHGKETPFVAQVLQLGELLLLPDPAISLAATTWSTAPDISVEIDNGASTVRGVVPASGLAGALQLLRSSCGASP
ncbi:hypothetical protein [Bradyrhizobium sp. LHD-71]|uniref:hypothetical protein n=1 Tax=Bradyrhizobium sp. LHD-71 TaxID=3072141 RepID=UPI00280DAED7|nr:hypothetical protein [Bradyrhizobium sp. LHD-71]MDQ8732554.1 hypothetical protein [Bradyrhizobium sp. LHD-71]